MGHIKPLDELEEGEISPDDNLMRVEDTRLFEDKPVDEEAVEMEKELEVLLKSPPKKRPMMKMYADEMEEQIQAKK